ncbi:hypothetical protein [Nocardia africana]|uniref:Uncharacterized protein n=1 Tax=Nocardia africana TaxID=134964 RepID=A0A378WVL7_9NOCA|nr:hypothetical protein [Nocardia africana]MCC3313830.1 hypothetical protein [Nocardia africana]SUA44787.1 Uncharacterised protein [Nocardia africana]
MAGYSGAPFARELGIRPGSRVLLANAPSGFALEPLGSDGTENHDMA